MDLAELVTRLEGFEWRELEVKEARRGVPRSVYETVSAFANTAGGHIVFGVREADKKFEIVGVVEMDKVQNEFLTGLRSPDTISYAVDVEESLVDDSGRTVLVFFIPEAPRQAKPVHLKRNISLSYIRKGACDHKCTPEEVGRFLRNAGQARFDGQLVERPLDRCFDDQALRWYRDRFRDGNASSPANDLDDSEFLEHWGLVIEQSGVRMPTVASILLFGTGAALRSLVARPVADAFWYGHGFGDAQPDDRWLDRRTFEGNLVQTWRDLLGWYMQRRTARFGVDPDTLERSERPDDYISFREAAINLLTHQDFEEASSKATIAFYADRVLFKNPGHAFDDRESLLKPGDKTVRNPLMVEAFRRVGVGERAGTGLRAIFHDWRRLGRVPPVIENDTGAYEFRLKLLSEELLSERQLLFQASLGARLTDDQVAALALLCRVPSITVTELSAALARSTADVTGIMGFLVTQVLARPLGDERYELASHLRERWPLGELAPVPDPSLVSDQARPDAASLVSDQAPKTTTAAERTRPKSTAPLELSDGQRAMLAASDTPRAMKELMEIVSVTHRAYFKGNYLQPLLDGGLLNLQFPDKPTHPRQRYVLTEIGAKVVARWTQSRHARAEPK